LRFVTFQSALSDPRAGEEQDSDKRTMWVGVNDIGANASQHCGEKLSLQDLYPRRPARNGTPTKGRWGWVDVDVGSSEKYRCRTLYPPSAAGGSFQR
jgi:hypothetical protein